MDVGPQNLFFDLARVVGTCVFWFVVVLGLAFLCVYFLFT